MKVSYTSVIFSHVDGTEYAVNFWRHDKDANNPRDEQFRVWVLDFAAWPEEN